MITKTDLRTFVAPFADDVKHDALTVSGVPEDNFGLVALELES